jgi:hypothetical protein
MESNFNYELQLLPLAQNFLRETAKWAKFISIIGFILIGLYVILALVMFTTGAAIGSSPEQIEAMQGVEGFGQNAEMLGKIGGVTLGIIYLLAALLYFFPIMYLFRFATKAKFALDNKNSEALVSSFENLKSHYKFIGILMIIGLVFMILGMIMVIVGVGIAAAM